MTISTASKPDLSGLRILVVEDEFYLAMEMQDEIERAGGAVIGPYGDLDAGLASLKQGLADCALLDINLGVGPSFEIADALRAEGVPFIFLTGYDASAIPDRFSDVQRVQKPANVSTILHMLAHIRQA